MMNLMHQECFLLQGAAEDFLLFFAHRNVPKDKLHDSLTAQPVEIGDEFHVHRDAIPAAELDVGTANGSAGSQLLQQFRHLRLRTEESHLAQTLADNILASYFERLQKARIDIRNC